MAATPSALASKITRLEVPMAIVGPQYCVPCDVELIATEKVFFIGNANVKDTNGNLLLKVKGRFLGIHDKRWLCDANDVKIVTLQAKVLFVIFNFSTLFSFEFCL
jgi:LURP-one-related